MRRARVKQPIAAVPSGIQGSVNQSRRVSFALVPRHGRGLVVAYQRGNKALVVDLATGQQVEVDRKVAREQLAELAQLIDQAEPAPQVLRGRWAAQVAYTYKKEVKILLRRRLGYVDLEIEYAGGNRWTIKPPTRRPAWFSRPEDWPQQPRTATSLREAIEAALELAEAGIRIACTRRDTERRDEPSAVRTRRAPRTRSKGQGSQASLFAA